MIKLFARRTRRGSRFTSRFLQKNYNKRRPNTGRRLKTNVQFRQIRCSWEIWALKSSNFEGKIPDFQGICFCIVKNFDYCSKFKFLGKISTSSQIAIFGPKFQFLAKISMFNQNLNFWANFQFLIKICIFAQNFNFWPEKNKNLTYILARVGGKNMI